MSTLTLIFALPLLAAIALAFVPRNFAVIMRAVAVGVTFVTMLLGVLMFWQFNGAATDANGYKFVSTIPWLGAESLGIACKLGVDGLNVGSGLDGRDRRVRGGAAARSRSRRARRSFTSCCS
ncbi:MAG: hypothetical protein V9H26_19330 [Verrucomicrobiota bacterium]